MEGMRAPRHVSLAHGCWVPCGILSPRVLPGPPLYRGSKSGLERSRKNPQRPNRGEWESKDLFASRPIFFLPFMLQKLAESK